MRKKIKNVLGFFVINFLHFITESKIYGRAVGLLHGAFWFVRKKYGPRLLASVARPMLACGLPLHTPPVNSPQELHASDGKIGTAERAASAQ